jgi:hypothetical protein
MSDTPGLSDRGLWMIGVWDDRGLARNVRA